MFVASHFHFNATSFCHVNMLLLLKYSEQLYYWLQIWSTAMAEHNVRTVEAGVRPKSHWKLSSLYCTMQTFYDRDKANLGDSFEEIILSSGN